MKSLITKRIIATFITLVTFVVAFSFYNGWHSSNFERYSSVAYSAYISGVVILTLSAAFGIWKSIKNYGLVARAYRIGGMVVGIGLGSGYIMLSVLFSNLSPSTASPFLVIMLILTVSFFASISFKDRDSILAKSVRNVVSVGQFLLVYAIMITIAFYPVA
jgi:hypothetical protein